MRCSQADIFQQADWREAVTALPQIMPDTRTLIKSNRSSRFDTIYVDAKGK